MELIERKEEEQNYIDKSKEIIKKIVNEYRRLSSYIEKEIINSVYNFDVKIKKSSLDDKSNKSKDSINNQYKGIIEEYIKIYENRHIKIIEEFIEDLKNMSNMSYEFNPPSINNFSNKSNELQFYSSINYDPPKINNRADNIIDIQISDDNLWENLGKEKDLSKLYDENISFIKYKDNNISNCSFKCSICKNNKTMYYCKHCSYYFCEDCYTQYKNYEIETNHIFIIMDDNKKENEKKKMVFLESFINIIKNFIIKCNYIMKNEKQDYVDPNNYRKFQYPLIKNYDFNNQIAFLSEINQTYNQIKENIDIHNTINENEINNILLTSLKDICNDLNYIEDNYYSDE